MWDDNRCPICAEEGKIHFLHNEWDESGKCWIEMCSNKECDYMMLHSDRRRKQIEVEQERRQK